MAVKTRIENIPQELQETLRWVRTREDDKQPFCVYSNNPASSTQSKTWGTFKEGVERLNREDGYLGFVFNDDGYVGIDIDHCLTEDGDLYPAIIEIIKRFNSYTEFSKSGDGIHIIVKGDIPFKGRQNHGFEIYKQSRFFVLTGDVISNFTRINETDYLDEFIKTYIKTGETYSTTDKYCMWKPCWSINDNKIPLKPQYPNVHEGSRHLSMVSFCGQWWNGGISFNDLLELALTANREYLRPPLEVREIENIVNSCSRYAR